MQETVVFYVVCVCDQIEQTRRNHRRVQQQVEMIGEANWRVQQQS